jgi:hypothetical protein
MQIDLDFSALTHLLLAQLPAEQAFLFWHGPRLRTGLPLFFYDSLDHTKRLRLA